MDETTDTLELAGAADMEVESATGEGEPARVEVRDLSHRFPGTDLLFEHLTVTFEAGRTVAVTGPSGCGKSTLLSILAGWEKPVGGTVERFGVGRVGWVFQNPYGVAERSALDHVVFPLLAKGMRRREAEPLACEAMDMFDLGYAADRRFADLSGGEAQRLMLARAVCSHPDMLLVDEPTAQLDRRTGHSVSQVLGNLAGQGMIVVVATHDPDTRDACDRIVDLAHYAPGAAGDFGASGGSAEDMGDGTGMAGTDRADATANAGEEA